MKADVKFLISITILSFLLNGCFSSGDVYDDSYYQDETVYIEYVPVTSPPPVVIVQPVVQIVEKPKTKRRAGGVLFSGSKRNGNNSSYRHRDAHRNSSFSNNSSSSRYYRSRVEKRIRKRKWKSDIQ